MKHATYDMRVCSLCRYDLKAEKTPCRICFKKFCSHSVLIDHHSRVCVECENADKKGAA